MRPLSVFISHSSRDKVLAAEIALLIQHALGLQSDDIRCTSAPGYRLPAGVDVDDIIRGEVAGARALVGLLTPASLESKYVFFELGARWGARLSVIPLMAHGVSYSDIPDPLRRINALKATDSGNLQELLGDLESTLNRPLQAAHSYQLHVERIVALAQQPDNLAHDISSEVVDMLAAARYVHGNDTPGDDGKVKLFEIWRAYNDHHVLRQFGRWLSASLPPDASSIVAVERSGIPPAVLAAADRGLPVFCVPKDPRCPNCRQAVETLTDSPSAASLLAEAAGFELTNAVLFDDSIHSGDSFVWARDQVRRAGGKIRSMFALIDHDRDVTSILDRRARLEAPPVCLLRDSELARAKREPRVLR
jgi:adenine/guanine phosphoribosyltransferase-like PRPP-binding protein